MIWDAAFEGELSVQAIIDAIVALLKKIFGFVAKEEGWTEKEEVAE